MTKTKWSGSLGTIRSKLWYKPKALARENSRTSKKYWERSKVEFKEPSRIPSIGAGWSQAHRWGLIKPRSHVTNVTHTQGTILGMAEMTDKGTKEAGFVIAQSDILIALDGLSSNQRHSYTEGASTS